MFVEVGSPSTSTNVIVYTLLQNGSPTPLSVSLPGNQAQGSDLANSVAVAAGDLLDIQITKAAAVFPAVDEITVTMEFEG